MQNTFFTMNITVCRSYHTGLYLMQSIIVHNTARGSVQKWNKRNSSLSIRFHITLFHDIVQSRLFNIAFSSETSLSATWDYISYMFLLQESISHKFRNKLDEDWRQRLLVWNQRCHSKPIFSHLRDKHLPLQTRCRWLKHNHSFNSIILEI